MERIIVAVGVVAVAAVVAYVLNRRRSQAPTQARAPVPAQLDRADFPDPDRPWLLVVWTSKTCASCERATANARLLASSAVAYAELPWQDDKELHRRYGIEDVPMIVLADHDGGVRVSFVGAPEFADLAGAVAAARGA